MGSFSLKSNLFSHERDWARLPRFETEPHGLGLTRVITQSWQTIKKDFFCAGLVFMAGSQAFQKTNWTEFPRYRRQIGRTMIKTPKWP